MIGTKLYQKKSQAYLFIALYGLLAVVGSSMATLSIQKQQNVSGAVGFMIVFGLGMAVNAMIKSRRAQVSVHEEFLDVNQSRTVKSLRYRNMTGVRGRTKTGDRHPAGGRRGEKRGHLDSRNSNRPMSGICTIF